MYLSKIEMTGFKSFADKTIIEFDQGMTAVVGPNGSGKSNLSEAIRWVLGEQSAKSLRGSRMEDVIFNGTQERKAVNIAKVTLVLNNEDRYLDYDYSEISITRSYNRNGDSQYLINNEQVRLKDIVDLLLDSGLGKNSFSIISQGQVEQIFLNKPEERRTIFEEAAGVQKYQYRKNEAQRRLVKSDDNLSRVKDIIHELELQLNPLKKQREAALEYQSKKETLKELEVSLYTHQIREYQTGWIELEKELKQINHLLEDLEDQNQLLSSEISTAKENQEQLIEDIDHTSDLFQQLTTTIEKLKAQKQVIERDINYAQTTQQDQDNNHVEYIKQRDELESTMNLQQEQLKTHQSKLEELIEELDYLAKEIKISQGLDDNQQHELRNQMVEHYQLEAKSNNEIQRYEEEIRKLSHRTNELNVSVDQAKKNIKHAELDVKETEAELQDFNESQSNQRQELQKFIESNEALNRSRSEIQQQLFNQERETQSIETRLESLQQMHDSYAGYYQGVRAVMQAKNQLEGIEGTVADLIQVEENYQLAIDTALGGALQHIVVSDDYAARSAVNYLKQQRAGRATFLPRPNIRPRSVQSLKLFQAQEMPGFLAVASEIVDYKEENENIIQNLLGSTLIVDGLKEAQAISRKLGHSTKIVTLDGDVLMPGGAVTGGRQQQRQQSMLQRQNEIKQMSQLFDQAKEKLRQVELNWGEVNQKLLENDTILKDKRERVNQAEGVYQQLFQAHQSAKQTHKQLANQLIILKDNQQETAGDLQDAKLNYELAQKNLEASKASIKELTHILEQHNLDEDIRREKLTRLEANRQEKLTEKAVLDVEIKQIKQSLNSLSDQHEEVIQWIENYESNRTYGVSSLEELGVQLKNVEDQLTTSEEESIQLQSKLQKDRKQRQEFNEFIREKEAFYSQLQNKSQINYQKQAKLQAQIEKNQSFIDNHLNHLNQEYNLTFELAEKIAKPIDSTQGIQEQVKEIRAFIDKLGPINLQAIEDYDELNERYELLVEQQEDLLTAMDQLQTTMDEMDQEVTKRFSATFKQINLKFQQTFKRLFGGGDASLELTDPKDILTTGIDIIAQPPGKKKQNLALLSGGERALTAIALLFSILEIKPVPFVILDEVEAALDDANVYRYGEYIKAFREQTQFIVITHRKGTMESADRLYGVTMERSGVSKLASVKLSEAEETLTN
ncbi:chromosome segregation protein SMC [Aerococcaceae bacterium WGS1372]